MSTQPTRAPLCVDRRAEIAALRTGGFVVDAEAHRRDVPRFCPGCGTAFDTASPVNEYWQSQDRVFAATCVRLCLVR